MLCLSLFARCPRSKLQLYRNSSFGKKRLLEVALVGRPNTGKSTLFNRLVGSKLQPQAIISPVAGTTRDRREGRASLSGFAFHLVDTGGLDDRGIVNLEIRNQVALALRSADVVLFLLDAQEGVTSMDEHYAQWLRRTLGEIKKKEPLENMTPTSPPFPGKQVVLVANKTEGAHLSNKVLEAVSEAASLGMGEPVLISASHGDGMADLANILIDAAERRGLDTEIESSLSRRKDAMKKTTEEKTIQLSIMGKPNVLLITPYI